MQELKLIRNGKRFNYEYHKQLGRSWPDKIRLKSGKNEVTPVK
jgi:hypothetical protein